MSDILSVVLRSRQGILLLKHGTHRVAVSNLCLRGGTEEEGCNHICSV